MSLNVVLNRAPFVYFYTIRAILLPRIDQASALDIFAIKLKIVTDCIFSEWCQVASDVGQSRNLFSYCYAISEILSARTQQLQVEEGRRDARNHVGRGNQILRSEEESGNAENKNEDSGVQFTFGSGNDDESEEYDDLDEMSPVFLRKPRMEYGRE